MLLRTACQFRLLLADDEKGEHRTKVLGALGLSAHGMRSEVRADGGHQRPFDLRERQGAVDRYLTSAARPDANGLFRGRRCRSNAQYRSFDRGDRWNRRCGPRHCERRADIVLSHPPTVPAAGVPASPGPALSCRGGPLPYRGGDERPVPRRPSRYRQAAGQIRATGWWSSIGAAVLAVTALVLASAPADAACDADDRISHRDSMCLRAS